VILPREVEVLSLIATGNSNKIIANQLCRDTGTINQTAKWVRVKDVARRLGVSVVMHA